jgi:hypothetical protein
MPPLIRTAWTFRLGGILPVAAGANSTSVEIAATTIVIYSFTFCWVDELRRLQSDNDNATEGVMISIPEPVNSQQVSPNPKILASQKDAYPDVY